MPIDLQRTIGLYASDDPNSVSIFSYAVEADTRSLGQREWGLPAPHTAWALKLRSLEAGTYHSLPERENCRLLIAYAQVFASVTGNARRRQSSSGEATNNTVGTTKREIKRESRAGATHRSRGHFCVAEDSVGRITFGSLREGCTSNSGLEPGTTPTARAVTPRTLKIMTSPLPALADLFTRLLMPLGDTRRRTARAGRAMTRR